MRCSSARLHGARTLLGRKTAPFAVPTSGSARSCRASRVVVRADLVQSLAGVPPEALGLGAAALLGVGGVVAWAVTQQPKAPAAEGEAAAEPGPAPLPRENAVLVFGSSGRMGRVLTAAVSVLRRLQVPRIPPFLPARTPHRIHTCVPAPAPALPSALLRRAPRHARPPTHPHHTHTPPAHNPFTQTHPCTCSS